MVSSIDSGRKYGLGLAVAALLFGGHAPLAAEPAYPSPRERILINDNWRFIKGDLPGKPVSLLFDVKPQWPKPSGVEAQAAAKAAADESVTLNKPATAAVAVLKPWILP